ncbi:hypothetical protein GCM10027294_25980 [Marinactinospora endophytica]
MTHETPQMEEPGEPTKVRGLRETLAEERALAAVEREDVRARRESVAEHRLALARLRERLRSARRQRRERALDERESMALAGLYRQASVSGARARVAAQIQQSREARALRATRVRSLSLVVGVPVLVAFGAWSTAGVHAGVTALLHLPAGSVGWWAAWMVEPALMAVVCLIIIGRAWLASAADGVAEGAGLDSRATVAEWGALLASITLNVAGAWPSALTLEALAAMVAHSVGPVGAAGTAWLLGVFTDSATRTARAVWAAQGVQSLEEMDLGRRGAAMVGVEEAEVAGRELAAADRAEPVANPRRIEPETELRTEPDHGSDRSEQGGSRTEPDREPAVGPGRDRSNVTPIRRQRVTDEELLARAREVYQPGMTVGQFRALLGVGMKKAHPLHQKLREEAV